MLTNRIRCLSFVALVVPALALAGCESEPSAPLAPTASALAPAKPASAQAMKFAVDKATSKIEFTMEAPQEKIRGRVAGASEGDLNVDLSDVSKTTGLVVVDISGIELYQAVVNDEGELGEEKKSDLQNEHARQWLEISPDAPEEARKKNSRVEMSITKIDGVTPGVDVTKMTGASRKVTFKATGDFLLHGRKTTKTVDMEATFTFDGDKAKSVALRTTAPFAVGLAEHDVHPREGFGKLAQKTLEILAPKVAKEAKVTVELTAKLPAAPGGY